jgi:hypothetical protein
MRRESNPPSPSTDRAALSEAWYRALYGTKPSVRAPHTVATAAQSRSGGVVAAARPAPVPAPASVRGSLAAVTNSDTGERRVPALANMSRLRPERQPSTPAPPVRAGDTAPARRTACRIAMPDGSVQVLIQQRGRRLHVVALSEGAAGNRVAAALQRARAALAAHGLRLDTD